MAVFKWLFCMIWICLLGWLVAVNGWASGIIAWFGCMFFGAFALTEREDE